MAEQKRLADGSIDPNQPRVSIAKALQVMFGNVPKKQGPPSLSQLKKDAKNVVAVVKKREGQPTVTDEVSLLSRKLKERGMSQKRKQMAYSLLGGVKRKKKATEGKRSPSIATPIPHIFKWYAIFE